MKTICNFANAQTTGCQVETDLGEAAVEWGEDEFTFFCWSNSKVAT